MFLRETAIITRRTETLHNDGFFFNKLHSYSNKFTIQAINSTRIQYNIWIQLNEQRYEAFLFLISSTACTYESKMIIVA